MPNGNVISLQLADKCPTGAIGGRNAELDSLTIGPPNLRRQGRTGNRAEVHQRQFGKHWPLLVDAGTLVCERPLKAPDLMAVVFVHPSGTYAINGTARGHANDSGWKPINPIWRDNPEIPGTKIPATQLIAAGVSLCLN